MTIQILRIFISLLAITSIIGVKLQKLGNFPSSHQDSFIQPEEKFGLRVLQQDHYPRISKKSNKIHKNLSNKHVLTKLGVKKVALGDNGDYYVNNDKSESNLLIVKLPPNPNYYINLMPCDEKHNRNCLNKSSKNLPFNFNINGKPNKIYHYNLPLVNTTQKRNINNRNRSSDSSKVLFHKRQTKNHINVYKPLFNNEPINSYFRGNGKFQNLYVMSKKKRRKLESANKF